MMTFNDVWKTLPIPGEYDAMDDCDKARWRGVIESAYNIGTTATPTIPDFLPVSLSDLWLQREEELEKWREFGRALGYAGISNLTLPIAPKEKTE